MHFVEIRHLGEDFHSCSVYSECSISFCEIVLTLLSLCMYMKGYMYKYGVECVVSEVHCMQKVTA